MKKDVGCKDEAGVFFCFVSELRVEVYGENVSAPAVEIWMVLLELGLAAEAEKVVASYGGVGPMRRQIEENDLFKNQVDVVVVSPVLATADHEVFAFEYSDFVAAPEGVDG